MPLVVLASMIVAGGIVRVKGVSQNQRRKMMDDGDICGFCGKPGADKMPHPIRWPGEDAAGTKYVHAACEEAECRRAHSLLSDKQREEFLKWC